LITSLYIAACFLAHVGIDIRYPKAHKFISRSLIIYESDSLD
jgi:hypothetical protein